MEATVILLFVQRVTFTFFFYSIVWLAPWQTLIFLLLFHIHSLLRSVGAIALVSMHCIHMAFVVEKKRKNKIEKNLAFGTVGVARCSLLVAPAVWEMQRVECAYKIQIWFDLNFFFLHFHFDFVVYSKLLLRIMQQAASPYGWMHSKS